MGVARLSEGFLLEREKDGDHGRDDEVGKIDEEELRAPRPVGMSSSVRILSQMGMRVVAVWTP